MREAEEAERCLEEVVLDEHLGEEGALGDEADVFGLGACLSQSHSQLDGASRTEAEMRAAEPLPAAGSEGPSAR